MTQTKTDTLNAFDYGMDAETEFKLLKQMKTENEINFLLHLVTHCNKCKWNATCINCNSRLFRIRTLQNSLQEVTDQPF